MQDSMNDIENMLMKAQEDICAKLGITQEILEKVFNIPCILSFTNFFFAFFFQKSLKCASWKEDSANISS